MAATPNFQLLLIEDDAFVVDSIRMFLPAHWTLTAAKELNPQHLRGFFHCVFCDMHLKGANSGPDGLLVLREIAAKSPRSELFAISGDLTLTLMEQALEAGARGFLGKPLDPAEITRQLEKIESLFALKDLENRNEAREFRWVGAGAKSDKLLHQIASQKGEATPILISGETGTGKEVVARMINAQEKNRPFVAINVAAISENLFESELFGYVKGAFTGADANRPGLVEAANNGDLFLDEIEALPLPLQAKLLRFLELGEFRRVGARETQRVKVRLISATNEDLAEKVKAGTFREDLLFRLQGTVIQIPPLRERAEDIESLAKHFLESARPRTRKVFGADGITALRRHAWPGNVRELKRACEQLNLAAPLPIIRAADVEQLLPRAPGAESPAIAGMAIDYSVGFNKLVENYEALVIRSCLKDATSIEDAATRLQISRSNLYKKIKDYGIEAN